MRYIAYGYSSFLYAFNYLDLKGRICFLIRFILQCD